MRIAVFSDVHANLEAFVAVLKDISTKGCGLRFCLGDTVGYGASPSECIALLQANRIQSLKGNHDEAAGLDLPLGIFNPIAGKAMQWTRNALKREERDWLLNLPYQLSLPEHRMRLTAPAAAVSRRSRMVRFTRNPRGSAGRRGSTPRDSTGYGPPSTRRAGRTQSLPPPTTRSRRC